MANFNLSRFAMGWDWARFRPEYQLFELDKIVSGQDAKWNELVQKNPSLEKAMFEIHRVFYGDKIRTFTQRYNVDEKTVRNFFNVYVGYHPSYGAYALSVGPYVGNKPADQLNKFAYFTFRFASTDSRNIGTFLNLCLSKKYGGIAKELGVEHMSSVLAPDDFTLNIVHRTGNRKGTEYWGREVFEKVEMTPEFMAANDYQKAKEEGREVPYRTVLGTGSYFSIKTKGALKILSQIAAKKGQTNELKDIILKVAQRRGIKSNIWDELQNNREFTEEVCENFSVINPAVSDIMSNKITGSQMFDALKTKPEQFYILDLQKEIVSTIIRLKSEDPKRIADTMNQRRSVKKGKAQGMFTDQIISYWLEKFKEDRQIKDESGAIIGQKTYQQLLEELNNDFSQLKENEKNQQNGFEDIDTALKMASLYYAGVGAEEIDPLTRAKMVAIPPRFEMPSNTIKINSQQLTQMRSEEGVKTINKEESEEVELDDINNDQVEDVELVKEVKPEAKPIDVNRQPIKSKPFKIKQKIPIQETQEEEEETIARTIKVLTKIAKEFKDEKEALVINAVIKKYQGRI